MTGYFQLLDRYGILGILRLVRDIIASRLVFRNVRLIRYPWYVRGARFIAFGKGFTSGVGLRADAFGTSERQIVFGKNVQVGDYVHIAAMGSVSIGDNVLMASKVYISDHDHGVYVGEGKRVTHPCERQVDRALNTVPVRIGDNVWIGEGVIILKGVEIGNNSVIGAASVVTKSVPEDSIVVGNPARVLRRFDYATSSWVTGK